MSQTKPTQKPADAIAGSGSPLHTSLKGNLRRVLIYQAIENERGRQEQLKASGKFHYTPADVQLSHAAVLAILAEEVGEVAREVVAITGLVREVGNMDRLRKELIQTAAVVVAWIEKVLDEASA